MKETETKPDLYCREDYGDIEDVAEYAFHTLAQNQDEEVVEKAQELLAETVNYLEREYYVVGFRFDAKNNHEIEQLIDGVDDEATEKAHLDDNAVDDNIPGYNEKCFFQLRNISDLLEDLEEAKEK